MWKLSRFLPMILVVFYHVNLCFAQEFFEGFDTTDSTFDFNSEIDSSEELSDIFDSSDTNATFPLAEDTVRLSKSIGFNIGGQLFNGDIEWTKNGWSEAFEVFFKIPLNKRFFIRPAIGYGSVSDGTLHIDKSYFYTSMITFDLSAGTNLFRVGPRLNNFAYLGIGLINFLYDGPLSAFDTRLKDRLTATSMFLGGGMEYQLRPNLSLVFQADYRFTNSDLLEGIDQQAKDGYGNIRFGVNYTLGKSASTDEDEKIIAELESGEFFDGADSSSTELANFEAGLKQTEKSEAANDQVEEYVRLKSRIDRLNDQIREKEMEIYELKSQLEYKAKKLTELKQRVNTNIYQAPVDYSTAATATATAPPVNAEISDFNSSYEEGLRQFYSRNYEQSIYIFNSLIEVYPTHRLSSNCQYWVGECYFGLQNYSQAIEAFKNIFGHPESSKYDDSLLMLARCFMVQGDNATARQYLEQLLNDFPESEYIAAAEGYLGKL